MPCKLHTYFCTYPLLPHLFRKAGKLKVKGYNYYILFVHWTPVQETVIVNSQNLGLGIFCSGTKYLFIVEMGGEGNPD